VPNHRLGKRNLIGFLLMALVLAGAITFLWVYTCGRYNDCIPDYSMSASYNATTNYLEVSVNSYANNTIFFNSLDVKDSKGSTVFTSNLPSTEVSPMKNATFSVNLGKNSLKGGSGYGIELLATNGQKYTYFLMLFEWIHVMKVTLSSPKTLLVEIQSFSNKTIVLDHATVSQWQEVQYSPDYKSLADIDITDGAVSPSELLPNQNVTLTISLKNELSSGNYCLKLHNASPEWVRGGERINFVAVR